MRLPPETYTGTEVKAMLKVIPTRSSTGLRNRALIGVLYRTGLRVSEALALRLDDVDFEAGTIYVRHGKGNQSRRAGIDDVGLALLRRWIARRERLGFGSSDFLFCSVRTKRAGGEVTSAYVRQFLPRVGRRAGIRKRMHAHGFRHSFAVGCLRDGIGIGKISQLLGHQSISETAKYLNHLCPLEAIEAVKARKWEEWDDDDETK